MTKVKATFSNGGVIWFRDRAEMHEFLDKNPLAILDEFEEKYERDNISILAQSISQ